MTALIWEPGNGMDAAALARLRARFRKPRQPMGEAWFMGAERRMFHELFGDLSLVDVSILRRALGEIASGTGAFGPKAEWEDWFHYLLALLLPRAHEQDVLESLVSAFVAIYPTDDVAFPYATFRDDVLATLGRCLMAPGCWQGQEIVLGSVLHRSNCNPAQVWCWWNASGDFSASLFFCLKYLPAARIDAWLASVLSIPSPHWRAQVIVWLVGARAMLAGEMRWPSELAIGARPSIDWEASHCLGAQLAGWHAIKGKETADFLSRATRDQTLAVCQQFFTVDVLDAWMASIDQVPDLAVELAEIPKLFEALYVQGRSAQAR